MKSKKSRKWMVLSSALAGPCRVRWGVRERYVHAQLHQTLCNSVDCNLLESSVHEIVLGKNTGVGCHFSFSRLGEVVMLKTQPLCTGAESNLRYRVCCAMEKNCFIALPAKGWYTVGSCISKLCPNPEGFGEEFYSSGSKAELLRRRRVCIGPALL